MSADIANEAVDSGAVIGAPAAQPAAAPPAAGAQPAADAREGAAAAAATAVQSRQASEYEQLAARLLYAAGGAPYTLAVTSAVAGEGVSRVSLGLATALATSTTRNLVLVDANLRRPNLHRLLDTPAWPGLRDAVEGNENYTWDPYSEELYGELRLNACQTATPNLWCVSAGRPTDQPARLATSEGARTALRALKMRFGFVVIDCPPVLSAVEAGSLCRMADGVVLVVRAGMTPREDIVRARELLEGVPFVGVVLNGV